MSKHLERATASVLLGLFTAAAITVVYLWFFDANSLIAF